MIDVIGRFRAIADEIVWATLAFIDLAGRARSRVVHPLWTFDDSTLIGWITTRANSAKLAHIEHCPSVSVAYWSPAQTTAVAECVAYREAEPERLELVWRLAQSLPPPVGFDPATMYRAARSAMTSPSYDSTPGRFR